MHKPKLLDLVRNKIRMKHYSIRTEEAYVQWVKRFIYYNQKKHPQSLGVDEIEKFLTYFAVQRKVSASTQNQAFNALVFLYKEVLEIKLARQENVVRAKKTVKLP